MASDLDVLADLAIADVAYLEARKSFEEMAPKIAALDRKLAGQERDLATARSAVERAVRTRRDKERESMSLDSDLARLAARSEQMKKQEAIKAQERELESVRDHKSELETAILELMDQEEKGQALVVVREKALEDARAALSSERGTLVAEQSRRQGRLQTAESRRAALVPLLSGPLRPKYERVYASKAGLAVALVERSACGSCHSNLAPQILMDLRKRTGPGICEACGRLMVWVGP